MTFNNVPLLQSLETAQSLFTPESLTAPVARRRVVSEPCLPERLPNSSFINREAETQAPKKLQDQLKSLRISISSPDEEQQNDADDEPEEIKENSVTTKPRSPTSPSILKNFVKSIVYLQPKKPINMADVQPFQIMKAVEDHDITFLMEVRDKAFPLLLQTSGGETPLVHAIRIGNKDIAIVLLGSFSRWVNQLEDDDVVKPQVQGRLKALRVGLKLAINEGLAHSQPDLIASFMQTLVMSEGDKWVWASVSLVARALNGTADGKPVQTADAAIRKFTTRELGKASRIASVDDYIANATADMLIMGAWSIVIQSIPAASNIPSYYFARDDRVYKAFIERYNQHKGDITRSCPRRLQWQLKVLKDSLQGRQITFRKKIEAVAAHLDHGTQEH